MIGVEGIVTNWHPSWGQVSEVIGLEGIVIKTVRVGLTTGNNLRAMIHPNRAQWAVGTVLAIGMQGFVIKTVRVVSQHEISCTQ